MERDLERARACPLSRLAGRRPVAGEGDPEARVLLVGQAPGETENRIGRPFVGRAGRYLDESLARRGWSRAGFYIASVEKYFPPGNRVPTRREMAACLPYFLRQVEIVDPEIVLLMGRVCQAALRKHPALAGRRVLCTVHPAAAMRFPECHRRFQADLRILEKWLKRTNG